MDAINVINEIYDVVIATSIEYDDGTSSLGDELCSINIWSDGTNATRTLVYVSTHNLLVYMQPLVDSPIVLTISLFNIEQESRHSVFYCEGEIADVCDALNTEIELLKSQYLSTNDDRLNSKNVGLSLKKGISRSGKAKQIGFVIPNSDKTIN